MKHILCVGAATLDQIYSVDEMPHRAEKYRAKNLLVTGGGTSANAAVALSRLGGKAHFIGVLGDDAIGDTILLGLEQEQVDCTRLKRAIGHQSPLSAIVIDKSGERMIVSYSDPAMPWPFENLPETLPVGIDAVMGDTRWQDGSLHLFRIARAAKVFGVLDGDRMPLRPELLDEPSHIVFSHQGLRDLTGKDDPVDALRHLGQRPSTWVGVTQGEKGVFFWHHNKVFHQPSLPVQSVDSLGAGDTWHGAFALALTEGQSEQDAIRFASIAAALKCTRFGGRNGAPHRQEVEDVLKNWFDREKEV